MNKVKRAIIMAAGIGKRLRPVTFKTPKPLIKVNGVRMIDTVIQALHLNGISEIYVVVGYLKEQFYCLEKEYKGLKLIVNPYYAEYNNISSLYVARNYISNAIILDGDQIIFDKDVIQTQFEFSGYNAVWTEDNTDEWLMQVNKNNMVTSCSRIGGKIGWQLFSISRWTEEDGIKLKKYLEIEFKEKKNNQLYWDDIAMFKHFDDFSLCVYPMEKGAVVEIDNINELIVIDKSYKSLGEDNEKNKDM